MRRKARIDGNQTEVVEALRDIPGVSVWITSALGHGGVDFVVGTDFPGKPKMNYLIELKDENQPPSKRKLTPDEEAFHKNWKGPIYVCKNLDEILKAIGII